MQTQATLNKNIPTYTKHKSTTKTLTTTYNNEHNTDKHK